MRLLIKEGVDRKDYICIYKCEICGESWVGTDELSSRECSNCHAFLSVNKSLHRWKKDSRKGKRLINKYLRNV